MSLVSKVSGTELVCLFVLNQSEVWNSDMVFDIDTFTAKVVLDPIGQ